MEPQNAGAGRNARMAETVRDVLWKNLQTLMLCQWGKENLNRLGKEAGTGSGTPGRLKLKQQSIGIDVLAKFAKPFGVHPWHLLQAHLGESLSSDQVRSIGAGFDALPDSTNPTQEFRVARLKELIESHGGNLSALGRALGYKDGVFIRQMRDGLRPITEKTVLKIEAMEGRAGWFAEPGASEAARAIGARFDALPEGKKVAAYALIDHVLELGLEGNTPAHLPAS
jgi:hypothetical protein